MNKIFVLAAVLDGCDGSFTEMLGAFSTQERAELEKAKMENAVFSFLLLRDRFKTLHKEWQQENPCPDIKYVPYNAIVPKWQQKWGKKKNADPAFLADFEKSENEYHEGLKEHHAKLDEPRNDYNKKLVEEGKKILVQLGASQEICDNFNGLLEHGYEDRSFEITEVPFGE
jgi:hypothetical protein